MKAIIPTFSILFSTLFAASYTEIDDVADLTILSPDLKEREIGKIVLSNGLQALLISDPGADQSAACISVDAGSWCDPVETPGMAHFCEHMLFMGTEKYPDTNEFSSLIADFSGHTNAFTASDKTVYMFSANTDGFLPIFDRFAHFFIDPIFDPSNLSREMHAVDQEFALMKENDSWREYMVFKEMGNPNHPNRFFSAGNSKTLSNIPQAALKKWFKENYGANRMRLVVYSPLPLAQLKEIAADSFSVVPKSEKPLQLPTERVTSALQKGKITSIKPIKNIQKLKLSWELPISLANDNAKSAELVAYALGKGGRHSLLQKLKDELLVDDIGIYVHTGIGKEHPFFEATLALSNKGIDNIELVISYFFQAIKGLKDSGIDRAIFHEKNTLTLQAYQYQSRISAFEFVSGIGRTILHENLASYPRKTLFGTHYDGENIQKALDSLNPSECIITLLSPSGIIYNKTEKWLEVPYTTQAIPLEWTQKWIEIEAHPDLSPPTPNPFVCEKIEILETEMRASPPICIARSDRGTAFYARCPEFKTPEAAFHLQILSPQIQLNARSIVLTSLYLDHLDDLLNATLNEAASAGMGYSFGIDKSKITLTLSGFSEKLPLLLATIVNQMPQSPPSKEQFDLYVSRLSRAYENGAKSLPIEQAKDLLSSLITQGKTTKQENLKALRKISFEDFLSFHKALFEKAYFEALFAGNLSLKTAESSYLDILHSLSRADYPKEDHPVSKVLHLPQEEGPFAVTKQTKAQGNAAILLIDEGDFSPSKMAAQIILSAAIKEPFFDTLRTKQKTGYIADSGNACAQNRLYQLFLVQSNTHQGEDLLHRFELFLEEFIEDFANTVCPSKFETLKTSAITRLKKGPRNLNEQSTLWKNLAFEENEDFSLIAKRIEALEMLSYEEFSSLSHQFLSRENRKRLAILYVGQIPSPFIYSPLKSTDLSKVASYIPESSLEKSK